MSSRSTEAGGSQGIPHNQDHEHFDALKEQGRFGRGFKKPEDPNQRLSDANLEAFEQMLRKPRRSGVAGGEAHNETYRRLERIRHSIT